jgi:hypothetical protein
MGYSHSWKVIEHITPSAWRRLLRGVAGVAGFAREEGIRLALEGRSSEAPEFSERAIRFNGAGSLGFETFHLRPEPGRTAYCKTEKCPYDKVVTATLILAAHYAGERIRVESNGGAQDWEDGLRLARKVEPSASIPNSVVTPNETIEESIERLKEDGHIPADWTPPDSDPEKS